MFPIHEFIPIVAILTMFVLLPAIVMYGIIRIKRENKTSTEGSAMGMRELEDRIQRAVEAANEPLRLQLSSLEKKLEVVQSGRLLESGGSSEVEAEPGRRTEELKMRRTTTH